MTWLQGITTWGALVPKLAQLACGEVADDLSVTCATGDRWVRDISTSYDLIRTPTSQDVASGTLHNRAGYFTLMSYNAGVTPNTYTIHKGVCKMTAVFSGVPTGLTAANRWVVFVKVNTVNTTPSDYSTARLDVYYLDLDANTTSALGSATSQAPNAAGTVTVTLGTRTFTINVSDPSGTLAAGTVWCRGFTATYVGGVDWFGPFYCRKSAPATFTVNPPGTVATDYDLVDIYTATSTIANVVPAGPSWAWFPGGILDGVGIKTNTALTGAQYTFSFNMALHKMRMFAQSGAANGQVGCDYGGGGGLDAGTYRRKGGWTSAIWMMPFTTAGSVVSTSQVQYWMSVKANKILIILNGDPGATGVTSSAGMWTFTPYDYLGGSYDKFPVIVTAAVNVGESTTTPDAHTLKTMMRYMDQVIRQNGSEGRDWQDKWLRWDTAVNVGTVGPGSTAPFQDNQIVSHSFCGTTDAVGTALPMLTVNSGGGGANNSPSAIPALSTKPNVLSGKWRMYGYSFPDILFPVANVSVSTTFVQNTTFIGRAGECDAPRGYVPAAVTSPWLLLPGGQFATGDELTDTISGAKFFLVVGTLYTGIFGTTGNGAGVAVLEN